MRSSSSAGASGSGAGGAVAAEAGGGGAAARRKADACAAARAATLVSASEVQNELFPSARLLPAQARGLLKPMATFEREQRFTWRIRGGDEFVPAADRAAGFSSEDACLYEAALAARLRLQESGVCEDKARARALAAARAGVSFGI
jgi:hypothetical protein